MLLFFFFLFAFRDATRTAVIVRLDCRLFTDALICLLPLCIPSQVPGVKHGDPGLAVESPPLTDRFPD